MDSPIIFCTFNVAGLILSLAALAVIVNALGKIGGMMRKGLLALLKGFILVVLSFLWTLSFGLNASVPSQILNIQAILLSFGMAMMVYSANKLIEIYHHNREELTRRFSQKNNTCFVLKKITILSP